MNHCFPAAISLHQQQATALWSRTASVSLLGCSKTEQSTKKISCWTPMNLKRKALLQVRHIFSFFLCFLFFLFFIFFMALQHFHLVVLIAPFKMRFYTSYLGAIADREIIFKII